MRLRDVFPRRSFPRRSERVRGPPRLPILLVLAGVGLGLLPIVPQISIDPDVIFVIVLPPLLYSAAVAMPWHEFRANLAPILGMAIGLVFGIMRLINFAQGDLITIGGDKRLQDKMQLRFFGSRHKSTLSQKSSRTQKRRSPSTPSWASW